MDEQIGDSVKKQLFDSQEALDLPHFRYRSTPHPAISEVVLWKSFLDKDPRTFTVKDFCDLIWVLHGKHLRFLYTAVSNNLNPNPTEIYLDAYAFALESRNSKDPMQLSAWSLLRSFQRTSEKIVMYTAL
ncbi:unnamed protein product [Hymenolepis diminuta]|uniref:RGS domain-containing protein n=1 Tax=Hymenolepis diminuta TaxID=6216 RepID=A0A0R3SPD6_HYMDI|nr:unnamed protein product [Hymenolepis diminuta]